MIFTQTWCLLLCIIAAIVFLPGCVSYQVDNPEKYQVNGVQYGITRGNFLGRWWDFYERGRSFADGGFHKEAELDLRRATAIRGSDNRRSRTYGLHFISYFGNRELGVALYEQGMAEEARLYLERSLEQDPSEKAEFYLNQCLLELSQNMSDEEAPVIRLDPLPEITNLARLPISGIGIDNLYVDRIVIDKHTQSPTLKKKRLTFHHKIKLHQGANTITVAAHDTSGNQSTTVETVYLDVNAPVISIVEAAIDQVVLVVVDESAFELVGNRLQNAKIRGKPTPSSYELVPTDPLNPIYVEFEDVAGNRNGIKIDPEYLESGKVVPPHKSRPWLHQKPILVASTSVNQGMLPTRTSQPRKARLRATAKAPVIEVEQLDNVEKVFQDYIIISGRLHGDFRNFTINGVTKIVSGHDVRFSFKEFLRLGSNNRIVLEASDPTGAESNRVTKVFNLQRLPPPTEQHELRASAALCPLAKEGGDRHIGDADYANLNHELYRSGRFQILPHKKEEIDRISEEIRLITEGWIKPQKAARLGQHLEADYMIACRVRPARKDVEIFGKLIDTASGKILASCDAYELTGGMEDYESVYQRFVLKLIQSFPVVERKLADHRTRGKNRFYSLFSPRNNAGSFIIDLGKDANIREGMKFLAYHRGRPLKDSETGEVVVQGNVIVDGKLRARTVKKRFAHLKPTEKASLQHAEYVVSQ